MLLQTLTDLDALLSERRYCANGKNHPVGDLYETVAESRWTAENILAIYLTNPDHAWMAVWMAVTRRDRLRKRGLRYLRPRPGEDGIGRVEIHHPDRPPPEDLFCREAHLYLFYRERFVETTDLDISLETDKAAALLRNGFQQEDVARRGWIRRGFVPTSTDKRMVIVDEWQFAAVGYGRLAPDKHVVLGADLIASLTARAVFRDTEVGEDYIG